MPDEFTKKFTPNLLGVAGLVGMPFAELITQAARQEAELVALSVMLGIEEAVILDGFHKSVLSWPQYRAYLKLYDKLPPY